MSRLARHLPEILGIENLTFRSTGGDVARQNYQHGKRQRELAKKQKHDEKLQRRLERKNNPLSDDPNAPAGPQDGTEPIEGVEPDTLAVPEDVPDRLEGVP
ncbi:MAG TPA: hypothetical protein VGS22_08515 [Thermoanaerobaculia bacterium]|nr:hypothetical protein [Thermoanaerobaculia bacterium]